MHDLTTCDRGLEEFASTPRIAYVWPDPPTQRIHGCDVPTLRYVPWESVWWTVGGAGMVAAILMILFTR